MNKKLIGYILSISLLTTPIYSYFHYLVVDYEPAETCSIVFENSLTIETFNSISVNSKSDNYSCFPFKKNKEKNDENNISEPNPSEVEQNSKVKAKEEINLNKISINGLNNNKICWWFKPNKLHVTPEVNNKIGFDLQKYDACYVGDTTRKVLYLTFDEGYENGYTDKILDILKANDVKAIFFVTLPYLKGNTSLIQRMVNEGHIVANHTNHHPSMPAVTGDEAKFNKELQDVEEEFKNITGKAMPKFFRPPMGEFSEKSLAMTKNLGYKTVFWSFAYYDWDINRQPSTEKAKKTILGGLHNGSIMLIHAVSKTNAEVLDEVLKEAKADGYTFELLD